MDKRDDFLCAWRTRFSVTDIPHDILEALESSNFKQLEVIHARCQANIKDLQSKLHQQEFLSSFLWDCIKNKPPSSAGAVSNASSDGADLDQPIPASNVSPRDNVQSNYDNPEYINVDHSCKPDHEHNKPVPVPRLNPHIPTVRERASAFVPSSSEFNDLKFPQRGNSLDYRKSPSNAAGKVPPNPPAKPTNTNSMKKPRPNPPPKRGRHHVYEEVDIPQSPEPVTPTAASRPTVKQNSFGKTATVDFHDGTSSQLDSTHLNVRLNSDSSVDSSSQRHSSVSSFKPVATPKPSDASPSLHRGSPVYNSSHKMKPPKVATLERQKEKEVDEYDDDEEVYDKPIPLTGEVDVDDSSSDEEPVYHNLMLVKKQQHQSFDSQRLYGNFDFHKQRLENSARKLSHRFSSVPTDKSGGAHAMPRKSVKSSLAAPTMVPVMKPLMTSNPKHNISGVTEEESHTETGFIVGLIKPITCRFLCI